MFSVKTYFPKMIFIIVIIIFLSSCSQTYIEKDFNYKIYCGNCQQTADGILSFEFSKYVSINSKPFININNNSDKYIVLDERYFVLTDNGMVVLSPVGLYNPNINYAYSTSQISSVSAIDKLSSNYFKYPYTNIDYLSKSSTQGFTTTESTVQQPLLMLPPKSYCTYYLQDYLYYQYLVLKDRNTTRSQTLVKIKWDEINNSINSFTTKKLSITFLYKDINDKDWKYYSVNFEGFDFKIDEIGRKK